jgi:hypothetical protein
LELPDREGEGEERGRGIRRERDDKKSLGAKLISFRVPPDSSHSPSTSHLPFTLFCPLLFPPFLPSPLSPLLFPSSPSPSLFLYLSLSLSLSTSLPFFSLSLSIL